MKEARRERKSGSESNGEEGRRYIGHAGGNDVELTSKAAIDDKLVLWEGNTWFDENNGRIVMR